MTTVNTLSGNATEDYQRIYKETFSQEISYEEAYRQGMKLLSFFRSIYKPVTEQMIKSLKKYD